MEIFVGNLSYSCTNDELKTLFEKHGTVTSAKITTDERTGQSKGFGFVEMPNLEEAQTAIAALQGLDFMGRALRLAEARPRKV